MGDQGRCRVGGSRAGLGRHRRQLQPNTGLPPRLRRAGGAADPAVPCKGLPPPPRAPPPRWLQPRRGSGSRQPGASIIYKGLGSAPGEPIKRWRFAY